VIDFNEKNTCTKAVRVSVPTLDRSSETGSQIRNGYDQSGNEKSVRDFDVRCDQTRK
jgi:hypothetical protein